MKLKNVDIYQHILVEAKKSEYIELINNNQLSQDNFNRYIFKNNNFRGPFKDSIFNDIIYRSINNNITIKYDK